MFTEQALRFLAENSRQNNREWFQSHKEEYRRSVVQPLAALTEELAPAMHEIDRQIVCDPRVGGSISRIYRDIRFSRDKRLYHESAWVVWTRNKKAHETIPAFYFEIFPDGFEYGCGFYSAGTRTMEVLRRLVLDGDIRFMDAWKSYTTLKKRFPLYGEQYKRHRFPEASPELWEWLDRKNIGLSRRTENTRELFSPNLAEVLERDFRLIAPVYHFFIRAGEIADAENPEKERWESF